MSQPRTNVGLNPTEHFHLLTYQCFFSARSIYSPSIRSTEGRCSTTALVKKEERAFRSETRRDGSKQILFLPRGGKEKANRINTMGFAYLFDQSLKNNIQLMKWTTVL